MKDSLVEKFSKSTAAVELGFLVAGVTVAIIAAIESAVSVLNWVL